ncbi:MAG: hypothetical protein ACKV2V_15225 [Blastocatellia bacterium]
MADIDIHYDPLAVNVNPSTVALTGLNDIQSRITLETPQPVRADTRTELVLPQPFRTEINVPDPIRTESTAALDIRPLALDQCLNLRFAPLPATCVRLPYQQHVGLTWFGVEILGLTLRGEAQTIVEPLPDKPKVVWGATESAIRPGDGATHDAIHGEGCGNPPSSQGALRIRLG